MKLEIGNWNPKAHVSKFAVPGVALAKDGGLRKMKNYQNPFLLFALIFVVALIPKNARSQNLVPQLELASHWDGHSDNVSPDPYNSLWGWAPTTDVNMQLLDLLTLFIFSM